MIPEKIKDRLPENLIFLGYRGSQAHGTYRPKNDPDSIDDIDLMGVFIGPLEHYLGFGRKETIESFPDEWDMVHYELRKFVGLLAKNNPNVLSMLWLEPESVFFSNDVWTKLVQNRELFASKLTCDTFCGYAAAQMKKMTHFNQEAQAEVLRRQEELVKAGCTLKNGEITLPAGAHVHLIEAARQYRELSSKYFAGYMGNKRKSLVLEHGYDAKNAAHLIRLLRMGKEFLETGEMKVMRPDAEELMVIKRGGWKLEQVQEHAEELFAQVKAAKLTSPLPDRPDMDAIEGLLVEMLDEHFNAERVRGLAELAGLLKKQDDCLDCDGTGRRINGCFGHTLSFCFTCGGTGKRK